MMPKQYAVGYGKPPLETRFKKGVCPNPAGRGRKPKTSEFSQIEHILYMPVRLTGDRKRQKLTRAELIVKKLVISALQGNARDALHLLRLYKHGSSSAKERLIINVQGGCPGIFDT